MRILAFIILSFIIFTCSPYNISKSSYPKKESTNKVFLKKNETNLVSNFSFEEPLEINNERDGWKGDKRIFSIDNSFSSNGQSSLMYSNFDNKKYKVFSQSVNLVPGERYKFSAQIKSENIKGVGSGATISIQWMDEYGKWLGGKYPIGVTGTQDWTQIDSRVKIPMDAAAFELICYVGKGMTGQAWFDDLEIYHDPKQFIDPYLISPVYRGNIVDEENTPIILSCNINESLQNDNKKDLSLIAELTDANQNIVKEKKIKLGSANNIEITFESSDLKIGNYSFDIKLIDDRSNILQLNHYEINKIFKSNKSTCYVDNNLRTIADNKPFFPIGIYLSGINESDLNIISESMFNCIMPYNSPNKNQMDLAEKYNLKVIYSLKDLYRESDWKPESFKNEKEIETYLHGQVKKFKDHPALLAWYNYDELPWEIIPKLESHYNWIRKEDPNHPVWAVLYQVEDISEYFHSFDIIGTDPYPIGSADNKISLVNEYTKTAVNQVKYSRPVWQVVQAQNLSNYSSDEFQKKQSRTPSYKEMRNMTWQSICGGAMGIFFYSFFDIQRNPDIPFKQQWNNLLKVTDEVSKFSAVLLSTENLPKINFYKKDKFGESVNWLAKILDGIIYLFVVNTNINKVNFEFSLSQNIKEVTESQKIEISRLSKNNFFDEIEGLGVKIYKVELY